MDIELAAVRQIARAICKSATCNGINCCQWPSNIGERHKCPVDRGNYDDAGRAALEACRELHD